MGVQDFRKRKGKIVHGYPLAVVHVSTDELYTIVICHGLSPIVWTAGRENHEHISNDEAVRSKM